MENQKQESPEESQSKDKKSSKKNLLKVMTGVVVGGAVGSILGLTLAPKKGKEMRQDIKDKSMEVFLKGKEKIKQGKPLGFFKRMVLKALKPKSKKKNEAQS